VRLFPMDAEVMFSTNAFSLSSQDSEVRPRPSDLHLRACRVIELISPTSSVPDRLFVCGVLAVV
jgi:hypothetical protein